MEQFAKAKEWVEILNRLNIILPTGFFYQVSDELAKEHPEIYRGQFDRLRNHYEALMNIEKSLIYRDIRNELQSEFIAVVTDKSDENVTNTIELIRRWFNLHTHEGAIADKMVNYKFFQSLIKHHIITNDEVYRLAYKMEAVIRERNVIVMAIKEAYCQLLPEPQQKPNGSTPEPQQENVVLPQLKGELRTDEAVKVFRRAIEAGLLVEATDGFYIAPKVTKAMVAYMVREIYQPDGRGGAKLPETALNTLLHTKRIGTAVSVLSNNSDGKPRGYEAIDALFE